MTMFKAILVAGLLGAVFYGCATLDKIPVVCMLPGLTCPATPVPTAAPTPTV